MKLIKLLLTFTVFTMLVIGCKEQKKVEDQKADNHENVDNSAEEKAVELVMKNYKDAIQNLTTEGTFELFTKDAIIFEQGKVEGTYKDYIDGHLGPELGHFKSFTFSDYKIDATVNSPYAYTTENYVYTIVLKADETKGVKERIIESKGVATSILENIEGKWKIIHSHTSFKKLNQ